MKIGIMSDSHDHIENIKKCVSVFRERGVSFVVHLGDFVTPNSVRAMNGLNLVAVFGNNDGDIFRLMQAFQEIGAELQRDFHEFEVDAIRFAAYHGTEHRITGALIGCGKYDVVLYGHTHVCVNELVGTSLVLNPGTLHGFGEHATVMVFDTENRTAEIINL